MNAASLYTIDPATGTSTLIGSTGKSHVVALAVHPITHEIYAIANENSNNGELLKLDPNTGAATSIGFTGLQVPDMTFNAAGVLYAWAEGCDACPHGNDFLATINLTNGQFSFVGDDGIGTASTGLAYGPNNILYLKSEDEMFELNPANGDELSMNTLIGGIDLENNNTLAFNLSGSTLYSVERVEDSGNDFVNSYLQTINLTTNQVSNIGLTGVPNLAAISFGYCFSAPIPTMNEWGLMIFGLLILNLGVMFVYRKETFVA